MYKLRLAEKEKDYDSVLDLCGRAASEANECLDYEKIDRVINQLFNSNQFIEVLEKDDEVVGVIIGMKTEHPFFDIKPMAQELCWFVKREHRGNKKTVLMLRDFMMWAKVNECNRISMSSFLGDNYDTCNKIFQKAGFTAKEVLYDRDI